MDGLLSFRFELFEGGGGVFAVAFAFLALKRMLQGPPRITRGAALPAWLGGKPALIDASTSLSILPRGSSSYGEKAESAGRGIPNIPSTLTQALFKCAR